MYIFLYVVCSIRVFLNASAYMRICFCICSMHSQVLWIPCMPADMYNVCRIVVGIEVEFTKLVCVGHPLEAG